MNNLYYKPSEETCIYICNRLKSQEQNRQIRICKQFALSKGYKEINVEYVPNFQEQGAFFSLLKKATIGDLKHVIVYSLYDLFPNIVEVDVMSLVEEKGVTLESMTDNLNTGSILRNHINSFNPKTISWKFVPIK